MPVTLLVIIYHNLVLWLCSLPPLGCHSKPQHLGKLLQESIQVLPILWNLPRCSSSTLVYIYGTHTVYWTIIFLSKCHLQEEEVDVSKPSRSDFNIFVSTTNSKCWQYLLLKNKKQKKIPYEYWEMSLLPVLGIQAFCQVWVSMCGITESLIRKTFIKCLLWAKMVSVASVSVLGGECFMAETKISEPLGRREKI